MTDERSLEPNHTEQDEQPTPEVAAQAEQDVMDQQPAPEAQEPGGIHETGAAPATDQALARSDTIDEDATSDDRLISLLNYVSQLFIPFILPVIILLSESNKKRPFQRYHAVQSLGWALAVTILAVGISIGTLIIQIIPLVGQLIGVAVLCLSPFAGLAVLGLTVYYGYQAYQGKYFRIPALTTFMEDQGWL